MPSKRHIELQHMAGRWLKNRSFKMCGLTEVDAVGYLADFVAIAGMYNSFHTMYANHSGLKKRLAASRPAAGRQPETLGEIDRWYVCIFEIKVSRADFLNTFGGKKTIHAKARMEPAGNAHWVVAEKGICTAEELPAFWGLLTPRGAGLSEEKMPRLVARPDSYIHAVAFRMLRLSMNFRDSYYERMLKMAAAARDLRKAIITDAPKAELLEISAKAGVYWKGLA